jgi:hypothetical protein
VGETTRFLGSDRSCEILGDGVVDSIDYLVCAFRLFVTQRSHTGGERDVVERNKVRVAKSANQKERKGSVCDEEVGRMEMAGAWRGMEGNGGACRGTEG